MFNQNKYKELEVLQIPYFCPMRLTLILPLLLLSLRVFAQGEALLDPSVMHEVKVTTLAKGDWDNIVNRYPMKEYTAVAVEIDGIRMDSVGIRIKGNGFDPGSMGWDKHQPFRLKFSKFRPDQRFEGLKDVNLHTHDLLTNFVGYDIWRTAGIPAPRTSFAKLWIDGEYAGFYMLVDEIEKVFLKRHFGNNDGNLYKADLKGAYLSWLGWDQSAYTAYQPETNEEANDKTDLIALLNAIHNTPESTLTDSIAARLNLSSFLTSLAIEMYICKGDAFYDSGHNYFLYNNEVTGRFEYLPWDLDNAFTSWVDFGINFNAAYSSIQNPFIERILKNTPLKLRYYAAICSLVNSPAFDDARLVRLIDETETFLGAHGVSFRLAYGMDINDVKSFLSTRKAKILSDFVKYRYACSPSAVEDWPEPVTDIRVFPNPARGAIRINYSDRNPIEWITLMDVTGKVLLTQALSAGGPAIVDVHGYQTGVYYIRIGLRQGSAVRKVVLTGERP
jgi:hypothetical protein